ncbi:hypothetical protein CDD81_5041 [Ophiocordyceps australis]|uniref:Uncharacterized protein n=1 Tax=Ophiocordyceps australis TaxID=1399860 RepID=A0A2C5XIN8_9HYPO|nr:hypothetical protein CDD81_5041 [Ophiocordyceps australis]
MANPTSPDSLVPAAILQQLAPQEAGFWLIAEQALDHICLAYIMGRGTHAIAYRIATCSTVADVLSGYQHLIYSHPDEQTSGSVLHSPDQNCRFPQPVHIQLSGDIGHATDQPHDAHHNSGVHLDHATIRTQVLAALQTAEANPPQNSLGTTDDFIHDNGAQPSMDGRSQEIPLNATFTNEEFDWTMDNEILRNTCLMFQEQVNFPLETFSGDVEEPSNLSVALDQSFMTEAEPSVLDACSESQIDWNLYTTNN